MKPSEMTTVELLEYAADHFEAVSRDMPPINPMRADTATRALELRSRAARLREALERHHDHIDQDGMCGELSALRAINAPTTPIAKDQP